MGKLNFIDVNADTILQTILTTLENGVNEPLYPGDERRIFAESALAPLFVSLFNAVNDACRQKMLRYARGAVLDALGENWKCYRKEAEKAKANVTFSITAVLSNDIIIPAGIRVTSDNERYFALDNTVIITAGQLSVNGTITAVEGGTEYNDIAIGAINTIVDISQAPLVNAVTNTNATNSGTDTESDDSYRERIRNADDAFSTAGPAAAYRYYAILADPTNIADAYVEIPEDTLTKELTVYTAGSNKCAFLGGISIESSTLKVFAHGSITQAVLNTDYTIEFDDDTEILKITLVSTGSLASASTIDIQILKQEAGTVQITPMGYNGNIPDATLLAKVLAKCTDPEIKPLTDRVLVKAPDVQNYTIQLTYYTTAADESACIQTVEGVNGAIQRYIKWQESGLNRDLNPDYLKKLILSPDWSEDAVGATMVEITSPVYQDLPPTTVAKLQGTPVVSHVVREGVV